MSVSLSLATPLCIRAVEFPATHFPANRFPAAPSQAEQAPPYRQSSAPAAAQTPGNTSHSTSTPAKRSSPYRITGIVIDSKTGSPIADATLTVGPMNTVRRDRAPRRRAQNQVDFVTTGPDGRFILSVPAAAGWELTAAARGYRTQPLDEHDGYSSAVVLTEATPQFDVTFRLTPASAIQGFVLDEAGEAVRGANVALLFLPPPTPASEHPRPRSRSQQMTDDRGFYKFSGIGPGAYQVRVTATPWYATSTVGSVMQTVGIGGGPEALPVNAGPDPLDVVYPPVWYPGTADPSAATSITLRGGDTQEASFRLLPVPGSHLRVAGPRDTSADPSTGERDPGPPPPYTYLTRLMPDGTEDPQITATRMDGRGNSDIPGLAPGSYLVHQQSATSNVLSLYTIQVGAGSPRTLDLSEAVAAAMVDVKVDPAGDRDGLQISFRDVETGNTHYAMRPQQFGRPSTRRRGLAAQDSAAPPDQSPAAPLPDRTVSLLPGKYEVFLNGVGDLHLATIDATGATAVGRTVTIGSGAAKLFLHTASGYGTVTGIVKYKGVPDAGAMVLLIPATYGNPSGLDLPSRDQSNTDGSFEMGGLLPGGYILLAIDRGWDVNWSDPSTLRRYLLHGTPLDIKPNADLKQTIEAQTP